MTQKLIAELKRGLSDPWTWIIAILVWMAAGVLIETTAGPEWKHFWRWPFG